MKEQFRVYYSHALDANIWGEDCPYVYDLYEGWNRHAEKED